MTTKFITVTLIENSYSNTKEYNFLDYFNTPNDSSAFTDSINDKYIYDILHNVVKKNMMLINNESEPYFNYKFINNEYEIKSFNLFDVPNGLVLIESSDFDDSGFGDDDLPFSDL